MLDISWNQRAREDLRVIVAYIAERNPPAARKLAEAIEASVIPIIDHPYLYRVGKVAGTREIVVRPNYIVVYRVGAESIKVLRVLHARQQYP